MANVNGPFGLRPYRHLSGSRVVTRPYSIADNYETAIGRGDPVEMTGTGRNIQVAAAANADNIGVFAGCKYKNALGEIIYSPYWPGHTGNSEIQALVWDDPNIIFLAQCDNLDEGDVGLLADWDSGAVNTLFGNSGKSVAASAGATTNQALRILDLARVPNNTYGAYAKAEVMFAEHVLARVVAGVGGI